MITDYEVITATSIAGLQEKVREMIQKGCQPLGGIAMLHEETAGSGKIHIVFAQAVGQQDNKRPAVP